MAVYLVSCDMPEPHTDFNAVDNELSECETQKLRDSVWLVEWKATSNELHDSLKKFAKEDGKLFIAKISRDWADLIHGEGYKDWMYASNRAF